MRFGVCVSVADQSLNVATLFGLFSVHADLVALHAAPRKGSMEESVKLCCFPFFFTYFGDH